MAQAAFDMHGFIVNVVVKHHDQQKARSEVIKRLNAWFLEDIHIDPPRPDGSLLLFGVNDSPLVFFTDDELRVLMRALDYMYLSLGTVASRADLDTCASLLRQVRAEVDRREARQAGS